MLFMSALGREATFQQVNYLLAGLFITREGWTPAQLASYQEGTFIISAMAFVGAYIYTLYRLLDRLNNNDLYPISFYYYTTRIIVACLVATVFGHIAHLFGMESNEALLLIGFAIGLAPDLFILAMIRRAFQAVKVMATREDPEARLPPSLVLLRIDELTRDKIDRLNELGIDSAQALACQNPFMIWPRLPYDLGPIVDWIAQAQLYVLVKDDRLEKLRAVCVADIFDLHTRLGDDVFSRFKVCWAAQIVLPHPRSSGRDERQLPLLISA